MLFRFFSYFSGMNIDSDIFKIQSNNVLPSRGRILISEPFLRDATFGRSVILLVDHTDEGSMGLVINKQLPLFLNEVKIYGERARKLKEIFLRHGFHLVYDNDLGEPIADGFYFTIGYPGMTSGELAKELMYYGVSAISLVTTGSHQEGLRACTSFIKDHQYAQLDERMKLFAENHPIA